MSVDEDLAKANELLKEARRLLLQEKAQECVGLVDGALARVDRVIAALAQGKGQATETSGRST